ncbi:hypothetical protein C488_15222 [Natrinema pellirubrum DSM 15624]|uniref:Uncharacterized protein n=1 Tax=Natrinema pellirubrum (strain DSM 15624 / CIP 106293 / JCM 10476 / NCIMB 786 / 157) TaxID=797303 RepID=L9YEZ9_NATP1|nr:hypothetical protein C488_15222 [Natrinema pellirubrum DSM 15624]
MQPIGGTAYLPLLRKRVVINEMSSVGDTLEDNELEQMTMHDLSNQDSVDHIERLTSAATIQRQLPEEPVVKWVIRWDSSAHNEGWSGSMNYHLQNP